jgi:glycosyltransferase involved in cell wall biosynthesis
MTSRPIIAVVIPCFNEEAALPITVKQLFGVIDGMCENGLISRDSYLLCCNDGSTDRTWQVIQQLHSENKRVKGVSLAHNRGHQYALLAGLMAVRGHCDAAISIDADLQDDINAIPEMIKKYLQGYEIVYGVRASRATDSWFKRTTARAFYSFQKKMGLDTIYDHADYRLMSNRALP